MLMLTQFGFNVPYSISCSYNPDNEAFKQSIHSFRFFHNYLCRGFGRCARQQCKPQRRSDDAPAPISEGAGFGFNEGLQLHSWSIIDQIVNGKLLTSNPTVSWLFVPPSPKLLTPVTGLTAEVLPESICLIFHSKWPVSPNH